MKLSTGILSVLLAVSVVLNSILILKEGILCGYAEESRSALERDLQSFCRLVDWKNLTVSEIVAAFPCEACSDRPRPLLDNQTAQLLVPGGSFLFDLNDRPLRFDHWLMKPIDMASEQYSCEKIN